jgi:hypothetical protein
LFGYLAKRNFVGGEAVFGAAARDIREAVEEKVANPFVATAGALIAVGSGRFEHFAVQEQWLRNLSNWFPGIPDGPIILARRLGERARTRGDRKYLGSLLMEGFNRGIPAFSLSVEWLATGLAEIAEDKTEPHNEQIHQAAIVARRLVAKIDPTKPLTTIRLKGPPS